MELVEQKECIDISCDSFSEESALGSDEILVSEEEWNRSMMEMDEEFDKIGDIQGNMVELNEEYEKKLMLLRTKIENNEFSEAKELCESILTGNLRYRCDAADFWIMYATVEKKVGTPDSVIEVYDRGCKVLNNNHRELINLALDMRSYVEEIVDEEEAVGELDLPLSTDSIIHRGSRALGLLNIMKRRERLSFGGEFEPSMNSPYRPEGHQTRRRENSLSGNGSIDSAGSTMIILTPVKASRSQRKKHKCDMILSPVRKSTRLMKNNTQDMVGDKLISTTYAYANNKCIINQRIDA